jgi:hypothetical protein
VAGLGRGAQPRGEFRTGQTALALGQLSNIGGEIVIPDFEWQEQAMQAAKRMATGGFFRAVALQNATTGSIDVVVPSGPRGRDRDVIATSFADWVEAEQTAALYNRTARTTGF